MEKVVGDEVRELVCEIVCLIILLIIVIPICVNASNSYVNSTKEIKDCVNVSVSINNDLDGKQVIINNGDKESVNVNLVLKIRDFSNEYMIRLGKRNIYLFNLDYTYDGEFYYYDLGEYMVDGEVSIDYDFVLVNDWGYDDYISYSFIAEVLYC